MLKFIIECRSFLYDMQFIPIVSYPTRSTAAITNKIRAVFIYHIHAVHWSATKTPQPHISFRDAKKKISSHARALHASRREFLVLIFCSHWFFTILAVSLKRKHDMKIKKKHNCQCVWFSCVYSAKSSADRKVISSWMSFFLILANGRRRDSDAKST